MNVRWMVASCWAVCVWGADPWAALAEASTKPAAEAEPALEELLKLNPGFHAARFNLGTLLLAHDPAKAAAQLQLATAATDLELAADAYHNLALAYQKQGRLEDALRAADSAAKQNPAYAGLRDEMRRIAVARADAARLKAEEEAKKLALLPTALPPARVGEAYRAALPLRGGSKPYRVTLTPSTTQTVAVDPKAPPPPEPLPPGVTLVPEGELSGTPTKAGDFQIALTITDAAAATVSGTVNLTILPVPEITTKQLPEAIIGLPYQAKLSAVGLGTPKWTVSGLPSGLVMDAAGTISGTPTALGTSTVKVIAAEVVSPPLAPHQAQRDFTLAVTDSFAPDTQAPAATAGAAYTHRLGVRGPAQTYRWRTSPESSGPLKIEADGQLHGTPDAEGTTTAKVEISAADGRSRGFALEVPVNPRPLIAVGDPLAMNAGAPADVTIPHTGGTPPFSWSVVEGALPSGTRIDQDGHVRGVAKDTGTYQVTVQLTDRWQASTKAQVPFKVEPASQGNDDKGKDDQQAKKDPGKDEQGKDDQGKPDKGQGDQGKDDQGKPDQAKGDQQKADQQKGAQDQGAGADDKAKQADAAQQAAALDQMAADHWLDQLPAEDRSALRYQLLDGGAKKPTPQGKSW